MKIYDGLRSLVTGLGTKKAKAGTLEYVYSELSIDQIETAYLESKIAQRIIDMPARDAGREWREWSASKEQISKIEATEKRLNVKGKVIEALQIARLRGGSVIIIGTGDGDLSTPLEPQQLRRGGLRYLTVLAKGDLTAGLIDEDLTSPTYNKPAYYTLATELNGNLEVHPSRLVVFRGNQIPGSTRHTDGFGFSELQSVLNNIRRVDGAGANAEELTHESKIDVIKIRDLSNNLRTQGKEYEALLMERFGLAMAAKSSVNTLLLDADEEWDQKSPSFMGITEIMDAFERALVTACGIPAILLLGRATPGLNSSSDTELRTYYDQVKTFQTLDLEPALGVLDECLIWDALGARPQDIYYSWRSLWQLTAPERADVAAKLFTALKTLQELGVPSEAIQKSAVNAGVESGAFPGLEGHVDEAGGITDPEEGDESGGEGAGVDRSMRVGDAAPRTLYVKRPVLNAGELIEWAKGQGFKTTLPADDLHVTVAYSREPVDWIKVGEDFNDEVIVKPGGPRLMEAFGADGSAKVLQFSSSSLGWRHEEIKRAGASFDYDDYQPHITISYDPDAPALDQIEPYQGRIVLGPERFEEVKEDWADKVKES